MPMQTKMGKLCLGTDFHIEFIKEPIFIFYSNYQQYNWTFSENSVFQNISTFTLQEEDKAPEREYLKYTFIYIMSWSLNKGETFSC